ncbi:MAG TPA: class I SAM-dependent methyltransferase [archaeon]|nr:class I SAM-dependent methyltransferase [archaeon]
MRVLGKPGNTAFQRHVTYLLGSPKETKRTDQLTKRERRGITDSSLSLEETSSNVSAIARKYLRRMNSPDFRVLRELEIEVLQKEVEFRETDNVLSLGSGPAVVESFIASNITPKGTMNCLDISHEMVNHAQKFVEKLNELNGLNNLLIRQGSATQIPLPDKSQDKVLALQTTFMNSPHFSEILGEVRRVLKTDAHSVFIFTHGDSLKTHVKNTRKIVDLLRKNHFVVLAARPFALLNQNELGKIFVARPETVLDVRR